MSCPIDEEDYPSPRILRANTTYSFYFSFILPEHLLETECEYIDCHRKLPSSLGKGSTFTHDDCAPDMARITYQVHAKVLHLKADNRRTMPFQHSSNITVVAAYEPNISTLPHHHFQDQEVSYSESGGFTRFYRTSKTLERSLLRRAPPGKVTLEASILNPFIYLQQNSAAPLLLAVSYSPHSTKSEPPRVESVSVKLRVYTYSSTISMTYLPVPNSQATDPRLGVYCESYVINSTVFPTSFASQWTQESAGHYTFNKTLTLQSPQNRTLVPNFWSCLVGRQYEASVTVVLSGVGSLSLKIPVEVTTPEIADAVLNAELSLRDNSSASDLDNRSEASSDDNDDDDDVMNTFSQWQQPRRQTEPTMYDVHRAEIRRARQLAALANINDIENSATRICQDLSARDDILQRHHPSGNSRQGNNLVSV